jgi:GT2 family glycosyltransferase
LAKCVKSLLDCRGFDPIASSRKKVPLGIVVVNYKSHDETLHFIDRELTKIEIPHVIVVVNNADDGNHGLQLAAALKAQPYRSNDLQESPRVNRIVISEPENLGYGRGNNLGFEFLDRHYETNWVLISNNDLVLNEHRVVESLIEIGNADPKIGAIGPSIRTPQHQNQSPHRYLTIWWMLIFPKLFYPVWSIFQKMGYGKEVITGAASGTYFRIMGCFFLVRTDAFRQAAGFDVRTFLYGEEAILSARLREHGFETYFSAEHEVIHHHQQTTSTYFSTRKTRAITLDSLLVFYHHYDHQPKWVCQLARFSDWIDAKLYEPIANCFRRLRRPAV